MKEESRKFSEKYQEEMEKYRLPEEIRGQIVVKKCLKEGRDSWVLLCQEKLLGTLLVVKWARGDLGKRLVQEYRILGELKEMGVRGIPHPYNLFENGEDVYFVREYVKGQSLFELVEKEGTLPERRIREIGVMLCRLAEQFQQEKDTLIHRDMKPENIILGNDGALTLVDFDSARHYRENKNTDTFLMGSRGTAAPEQYGCQQSDHRTDVYGIGRTLWYLAAGSYEEKPLENAEIGCRLRKIIRKASAFDPANRYGSAAELEKALQIRKINREYIVAASGILLAAAVGIVIYWNMDSKIRELADRMEALAVADNTAASADAPEITPEPPKTAESSEESAEITKSPVSRNPVTFKEPLIEQAVRQELGLSDTDPITEDMLLNVTALRIAGTTILNADSTVEILGWMKLGDQNTRQLENGGIRDLSDLEHMKHLVTLILCNQEIEDISVLENLSIQTLYLAYNRISDISVLKTLPYLENLSLLGNPVENIEILGECERLQNLNLSDMKLKNLNFLENLQLNSITIMDTEFEEGMDGLISQKQLFELCLNYLDEETMDIVRQLDGLEAITLWGEYMLKNLKPFAGMENLKSIVMMSGLESLEGIEDIPSLEAAFLVGSDVHDLSPVRNAKKLMYMDISGLAIFDMSPLLETPALKSVSCDAQQAEEIRKLEETPGFELQIQG